MNYVFLFRIPSVIRKYRVCLYNDTEQCKQDCEYQFV